MVNSAYKQIGVMSVLLLLASILPAGVHAQLGNATIAKTYVITGTQPKEGDLISFDRATQTFHLAEEVADPNLFGVAVINPVVVLRLASSTMPVVTEGEVTLAVTTAAGPIRAGEYLTSSVIPGKAQKARASDAYIIGTALAPFPGDASSTTATTTLQGGFIRVLLTIGLKPGATPGTGKTGTGAGQDITNDLGLSTPVATLIKYFLAALVVFGSIYIAFRNFGANMRDSIISVGRNPLAKGSIQSMVVINTVLIVLVSAVGLFLGLMILFVQL